MSSTTDIDITATALEWHESGHGVAIATVISTWGSAPRRAGSQMIIRDDGLIQGSVSGGCIEGAVAVEGEELIVSSGAKLLKFGITNSEAWEIGLACGGKISVLVQGLDEAHFKTLGQIQSARNLEQPIASLTELESGEMSLAPTDLAANVLRRGRPEIIERHGNSLFINPFNPPLKLVLVGAVHISQALAPMARLAGYKVTIIDPRGAFSNRDRFPEVELVEDWPDDGLAKFEVSSRTAVVTLTHDPKLDDAALGVALNSAAFYIGSLGSKKTHAARLERLRRAGIDEDRLDRIKGPVGLAIGAATPAEIAISILAEMTMALRKQD